MAETPSNMLPLGTIAPLFTLTDTRTGKLISLDKSQGEKATVIMFICNHCPYVIHIQNKLVKVAKTYQEKGIQFIAISSNDALAYPADGPTEMRLEAEKNFYPFPYLYDETQAVAKAYQAACTPDFYLFDAKLACVYRGRFDRSTPGNKLPVNGHDLITAMDALLAHKPIPQEQFPSVGCNIKWRKQKLQVEN